MYRSPDKRWLDDISGVCASFNKMLNYINKLYRHLFLFVWLGILFNPGNKKQEHKLFYIFLVYLNLKKISLYKYVTNTFLKLHRNDTYNRAIQIYKHST